MPININHYHRATLYSIIIDSNNKIHTSTAFTHLLLLLIITHKHKHNIILELNNQHILICPHNIINIIIIIPSLQCCIKQLLELLPPQRCIHDKMIYLKLRYPSNNILIIINNHKHSFIITYIQQFLQTLILFLLPFITKQMLPLQPHLVGEL